MVLTARDAADRGAEIRTRTRAVEIRQADGIWHVTVEDTLSGARTDDQGARAGQCRRPLGRERAASGAGVNAKAKVRLVQGSHIVVRKLYDHDRAYMFQNADGRIVFVDSLPGRFHADRHHRPRLRRRPCQGESVGRGDQLSLRLRQRISGQAGQRRRTWSGPIPACARSMTTAPAKPRPPPATMCSNSTRPAACRCCRSMAARSPPIAASPRRRSNGSRRIFAAATKAKEGWTGKSPLPGGDMDVSAIAALAAELVAQLSVPRAGRMPAGWRMPTARARQNCSAAQNPRPISARSSAPRLTEREVRYLMANEWAVHRRRRRLAALQARTAPVGGRDRRARRLDGGPPCSR